MKKTDSSLKDKVIGKVKEVEGKVTGDKAREFYDHNSNLNYIYSNA